MSTAFAFISALVISTMAACGPSTDPAGRPSTDIQAAAGDKLIVDHTNFDAFDHMDAGAVAKLKTIGAFFAHASVGENIVGGMRKLAEQDASRYGLAIESAGDRPGHTRPGTLYEYPRGNPGAPAKIWTFAGYVENGWRAPTVNVVVNKFCFIDQDDKSDDYIGSMEHLAQQYPDTVFVFTTMPICVSDGANPQREAFNAAVRAYARRYHKPLLDIADIECWNAQGVQSTQNGAPSMCQEYSSDGGHLNDLGSERVGKGFYTLLALLADHG